MELRITVFDWTETTPPGDFIEVATDTEPWRPDLEFGGDDHSFGMYKVGEPGTFFVWPDGIGGTQIEVGFIMTDEMVPISGNAQALTNVEIYDSTVLVWGLAIPGFEKEYDR